MKRFSTLGLLAIALTWGGVTVGCKEEAADDTTTTTTDEGSTTADEGAATDEGAADSTTDGADDDGAADDATGAAAGANEAEGMAALAPADRELAVAQKICPVSGDDLGTMGTPIKVTVEGKDVFVCCDACVDPLKEDPAQYLAKLETGAAEGADN